MLHAERLLKENIAEYLVHMYQTEDLLRAFDLDMALVSKYVLSHIPDEADRAKMLAWYSEILNKMKAESIHAIGHLAELIVLRQDLSSLHARLLKVDRDYRTAFVKAFSHIEANKEASQGQVDDDVQVCLNGVYGFLLLRLNGQTVSEEDRQMVESFGALLSRLSSAYRDMA